MEETSFDKRINDIIMFTLISSLSAVISSFINGGINKFIEYFKQMYNVLREKYLDMRYGKMLKFTYVSLDHKKIHPTVTPYFIDYVKKHHNYVPKSFVRFSEQTSITTDDSVIGNEYIGVIVSCIVDDEIKETSRAVRNSMTFYSRLHTIDEFEKLYMRLLDTSNNKITDKCIVSCSRPIGRHKGIMYNFDSKLDVPYATETIDYISKIIEEQTAANILMYGPPGTGKTSIIKYVANKFNAAILLCKLSGFSDIEEFRELINRESINCVDGKTAQNVSIYTSKKFYVFEDFDTMLPESFWSAKNQDIVFDKKDETIKVSTFCNYTYSDLLNLLDGIIRNDNAYLFFTTNHLERIDEAFYRPGRMHLNIYVGEMTKLNTIAFIKDKYGKTVSEKNIKRNACLAELYSLKTICKTADEFINKLNASYYETLGKNIC